MSTLKDQAEDFHSASSNNASIAICAGAVAICASAFSMLIVANLMKAVAKAARVASQGS